MQRDVTFISLIFRRQRVEVKIGAAYVRLDKGSWYETNLASRHPLHFFLR